MPLTSHLLGPGGPVTDPLPPQPFAVRPVTANDKELLERAFERLSAESRQRRFLSPKQQLTRRDLVYLTEVEHVQHVALVAIEESGGQAVGVARFVRDADQPAKAEAAVAVVDDRQGEGIGTLLLEQLDARARELGVSCFVAEVLPTNRRRMERLFGQIGTVRSRRVYGAVQLDVELRRKRPAG